ncbi:MarR family transcriptional regulator [Danxiaibacter flavus]|uniref:MarR family transcriptional regulator n=1 Tax=Danxiaibacter flavus TaxID=3049108 RepID=A0ABV3ZP95_9BACT|nr:MarR family transcriptional regulator [Chitinophagaceae bacterium DXS]
MKTNDCRYSECLYFSSAAFARQIEKLAQESWKPVDLSPSHAYMLMMIIEDAGIQPGILAENLMLTPSTITRLIEKLESKKLVVRTSEGKVTNVYPTPKAKELFPLLKQCSQKFNEAYSAILGREESSRLVQTMNKLTDKFTVLE